MVVGGPAAAAAAARHGPAARRAAAGRARRARRPGFDRRPPDTSFGVFDAFVAQLADGFAEARAENGCSSASPDHDVTTTYLGTSTGLRRRWVQPTGTVEVNAKSADLRPFGVGRAVHPRTSPTSIWLAVLAGA